MVPKQEREAELPERWSAKAKVDVVLRLLRGESVEAVSREVQVPAHELEAWRRTFLESAMDGLKRRHGDVEVRLLKQAQAKVGSSRCGWNSPRCSSKQGGTGRSWRG